MRCLCTQLDMITDVFNRLVSSCHAKCIATRYAEPDLNKGESVCIDRCACGTGRAAGE
jgi:import inner membrane translocase subunit TIM10